VWLIARRRRALGKQGRERQWRWFRCLRRAGRLLSPNARIATWHRAGSPLPLCSHRPDVLARGRAGGVGLGRHGWPRWQAQPRWPRRRRLRPGRGTLSQPVGTRVRLARIGVRVELDLGSCSHGSCRLGLALDPARSFRCNHLCMHCRIVVAAVLALGAGRWRCCSLHHMTVC
jgi:hypothetical protein